MVRLAAKLLTLPWEDVKRLVLFIGAFIISIMSFIPSTYFVADSLSRDRDFSAGSGWIFAVCFSGLIWTAQMVLFMRVLDPILGNSDRRLEEHEARWNQKEVDWTAKYNQLIRLTEESAVNHKPGFIYFARRPDGIMKLGCTDNLNRRIQFHETDYGVEFELVKSWLVPDKAKYEKSALRLTRRFRYKEGNRRELCQMTSDDVARFITAFDGVVQRGAS